MTSEVPQNEVDEANKAVSDFAERMLMTSPFSIQQHLAAANTNDADELDKIVQVTHDHIGSTLAYLMRTDKFKRATNLDDVLDTLRGQLITLVDDINKGIYRP